jgi:hypothetical protein
MPTDPRTRPVYLRSFARPQPPFTDEQVVYCLNAAEAVVNEVQAVTGEVRFPRQRWIDWLCRRTEAYFRTSRGIRSRLTHRPAADEFQIPPAAPARDVGRSFAPRLPADVRDRPRRR